MPETKQHFKIVINRSSVVDMEQAIKLISSYESAKDNLQKPKFRSMKKIALRTLDTSVSLYHTPSLTEIKQMNVGCLDHRKIPAYGLR